MFRLFFWEPWIASKEGVRHMPAVSRYPPTNRWVTLCGLLSDLKEPLPKGKQWKTIIILSILNFALSNGFNLGVKYISSGLGAIINAIFPIWIVIIFF
jgi:drug/metabolite transporter (DMT)-like permease